MVSLEYTKQASSKIRKNINTLIGNSLSSFDMISMVPDRAGWVLLNTAKDGDG